jgi:hypothetical protein
VAVVFRVRVGATPTFYLISMNVTDCGDSPALSFFGLARTSFSFKRRPKNMHHLESTFATQNFAAAKKKIRLPCESWRRSKQPIDQSRQRGHVLQFRRTLGFEWFRCVLMIMPLLMSCHLQHSILVRATTVRAFKAMCCAGYRALQSVSMF